MQTLRDKPMVGPVVVTSDNAAQHAETRDGLWKTYKRADGEMIWGEYGWVADLDYFDGEDTDYLEIVEETWQLVRLTNWPETSR